VDGRVMACRSVETRSKPFFSCSVTKPKPKAELKPFATNDGYGRFAHAAAAAAAAAAAVVAARLVAARLVAGAGALREREEAEVALPFCPVLDHLGLVCCLDKTCGWSGRCTSL